MIIASENIGPEPWHGTEGGTSNHKCKCLACRTVWKQYCLKRRAERAASIDPNDERHGKYSFYVNYGCRCDPCRDANNARARDLRKRRKVRA